MRRQAFPTICILFLFLFLSACGGDDVSLRLSSIKEPGQTLASLSQALEGNDSLGLASGEQPRTCKSAGCALIASILVSEVFSNSPSSVMGQLQTLDALMLADQEAVKDEEVHCLKLNGLKYNLDLTFNPGSFPYILSCLSPGSNFSKSNQSSLTAYGLNYDTGFYSVRSEQIDGSDIAATFVNADEFGNEEAWQLQMFEGRAATVSHVLLKNTNAMFEIALGSSAFEDLTSCGIQLRGAKGLVYVEGTFLEEPGVINCEKRAKRSFCFDMKRWAQIDSGHCLNLGLSNFELAPLRPIDFNIDNIKTELSVADDIKKLPILGAKDKGSDVKP